MQCKYTIFSNTEFVDALKLARECVQLWESYMNELEKRYRQNNKDALR